MNCPFVTGAELVDCLPGAVSALLGWTGAVACILGNGRYTGIDTQEGWQGGAVAATLARASSLLAFFLTAACAPACGSNAWCDPYVHNGGKLLVLTNP